MDAAVPPKATAVAPVKLVPVIVIVVPVVPDEGVKDVMVGAAVKPVKTAVPPGVVTCTVPFAPVPTVAFILVALTKVKLVAAVPPKLTAVAPVKFVPVIVTVAPDAAKVGVKDVMVGTATAKPGNVAVPMGVVTDTLPLLPAATTAVILVLLATINDAAAVPPNLTAVAPVKLVPVLVTLAPTATGVVNAVIVGAALTWLAVKVKVPPGVVTDTLPGDAAGTTAEMVVALTTVYEVAEVPPNFTAVVPVKLVPVMVTIAPVAAEDGVMAVIVGAGITKPDMLPVPNGVVTDTLPVEPPPAITAVMLVELFTTNEADAVPPKLTAVAPVKLVPVIVTVAPVNADVGVNEVMVGAAMVKPAKLAVPPRVVTDMVPEAPAATTAVMLVELATLKEAAAVPPKLTAVAPVKLVPVIVTVAPEPAEVGVNEVTVGAGNVKPARVAVPPNVVTDTLPAEPLPNTAVMLVELTIVYDAAAVPPKLTADVELKSVPVI